MVCSDDRLMTIRGLIVPAAWDEKGKVTAVAISAFDEQEYMLDYNEKRDQLFSLIRKEVEVTGRVREESGKRIITVRKFLLKKR